MADAYTSSSEGRTLDAGGFSDGMQIAGTHFMKNGIATMADGGAIATVPEAAMSSAVKQEREQPVHLPPSGTERDAGRRSLLWGVLAIAILLIAIYLRIAWKLVADWYNFPDYSHGFLVPLFAGFLLWDRRTAVERSKIEPSWAGVPVIIFGIVTVFFGVYGAELFLSRVSFVIIAAGLIWTFFGIHVLRAVRFPLAVLLLAIPFPAIIYNQITFPLQLLASQMASSLLPLLGVPVFREGNVIQLPVMKLEVAEACSGIRSLMSLFTLAVFYGYFLEKTTGRRWILALASIPIAVAANALRIVGTGLCVQYWDPSKGEGFFHEFSGWVMFVISLSFLYLLHRAMKSIGSRTVRS